MCIILNFFPTSNKSDFDIIEEEGKRCYEDGGEEKGGIEEAGVSGLAEKYWKAPIALGTSPTHLFAAVC